VIDIFNSSYSWHTILFSHPIFKIYLMLMKVEISHHLECPRFDLLLFNHLLQHICTKILFYPFRAPLKLERHHHVTKLSPSALNIPGKYPRKLFVNVQARMTNPVMKHSIFGQKTFSASQNDIRGVMI